MRWQTRPVEVKAIQWNGFNAEEMRDFGFEGYLAGLEIGSFLVKTAKGTFELYSESAFHMTHDRILVWEDNI